MKGKLSLIAIPNYEVTCDELTMDLTPELLLTAYAQGIFPMADEEADILVFAGSPRDIAAGQVACVPFSPACHTFRRYDVRFDSAFTEVMAACAAPAPDRELTWISDELIEAYTWLHELGFAHSVEAWLGDELVGGLYGVSLRGLFAGESMFSIRPNASKVALYYLVEHLLGRGFTLLDVQFQTPHLAGLGSVEVSQARYRYLLKQAMALDARF